MNRFRNAAVLVFVLAVACRQGLPPDTSISESPVRTPPLETPGAETPSPPTSLPPSPEPATPSASTEQKVTIPDVVGLTRLAATSDLERAGLTFAVRTEATDEVKPGRVISQAPRAGRRVRATRRIDLSVAKPRLVSAGMRCPSDPLLGIYHPDRLQVLQECVWFLGTVVEVRPEDDGDHHIDIAPDGGFEHFLNAGDREHQDGGLLVEIVEGQALPIPELGEHISVFGTSVYDRTHGWNEIHPIWAIKYLDSGNVVRELPPDPPLYNPDETDGGGGGSGSGSGRGGGGGGSNCDPNYTGACLNDGIGDYDCGGGSGNGPNYVYATVHVVGEDVFGLDSDGNGLGCE